MDFILDLIGRFHPLIVHLPIGFIVIGLMSDLFFRKKKEYIPVIKFIFLWAFISSIFSIVTGYFQYDREGYTWENIEWHLIMGVLTSIFCLLFFLHLDNKFKKIPKNFLFTFLALSLIITGHLGGNITHGKDHLIEPLPHNFKSFFGEEYNLKKIKLSPENYKDENFYNKVVQPILNQRCVSCHNNKKSNGGLKLNNYNSIIKGGKNGPIIFINNSIESKMYKRMILPLEDEYHMPPKSRTQPTKEEINLIKIWIDNSASRNYTIGQLQIKKEQLKSFFSKKLNGIFPDIKISQANPIELNRLREKGFQITEIFQSSPFLRVSCINFDDFRDYKINELLKIQNNIVELDLSGTKISDNIFEQILKFKNLTVLKLNETLITGNNIEVLSNLSNLKKIDINNSKFNFKNLKKLYNFPGLIKVNIYNSENLVYENLNIPLDLKNVFNLKDYKLNKIKSDSIVYPFKVYGE